MIPKKNQAKSTNMQTDAADAYLPPFEGGKCSQKIKKILETKQLLSFVNRQ